MVKDFCSQFNLFNYRQVLQLLSDILGLFFLAEPLAPFIIPLLFAYVKRKRGKMSGARSTAKKNRLCIQVMRAI